MNVSGKPRRDGEYGMDSAEFLAAVWDVQGEGIGYVCHRRWDMSWHERQVRHPWETDQALADLEENSNTYFTPNLFLEGRRREFMKPSRWLYADLDTVDPLTLNGEKRLRPTVAWTTSPDRFQALWLVQLLSPETHQKLNKQLTYLVGADRSGWDASQVLRLPGTVNHKYESQPKVELLWWDNHPPLRVRGSGVFGGAATGGQLHVVEVDKRPPAWIRQRLRMKSAVGDRSKVLFKMEADLLSKGWSKDEVFTLLRQSVWNKFDDKRLSDDIHRVAERFQ
jgi:hypothetical protein